MSSRESAVRALRENTTDGAAVVARQAIEMLRAFLADAADEGLATRTRARAEAMLKARPTMAAVGSLVGHWMSSFAWPGEDFRQHAIAHCDAILARADLALEETVRHACRRLSSYPADSVFLTHSASSTIRAVVVRLPFELMVTASEPGGEGRRLAADLGVACVEDKHAAAAVRHVAGVVVGADAIGTETFVNKVGTRLLATVARSAGTPFFVVAESYKRISQACPLIDEAGFEAIPNDLVTAFLSDETAVFAPCCVR